MLSRKKLKHQYRIALSCLRTVRYSSSRREVIDTLYTLKDSAVAAAIRTHLRNKEYARPDERKSLVLDFMLSSEYQQSKARGQVLVTRERFFDSMRPMLHVRVKPK